MTEAQPLAGDVAVLLESDPAWTPHLAAGLAEAGAKVVVAGGSWHGADMTLGGRFEAEADVAQAIAKIESRLARPRLLVTGPMRPVFSHSEDSDDSLVASAMAGVQRTYRWNRILGSRMAGAGGGAIVNFAFGFAERGVVGASAFAMSQASIVAATRSLAIEWASKKVRVCGIGLGWYETEQRPLEEQQKERLVRFLPLRRKGAPSDAIGLMVYLASGAAGFVSGQTVWVDGGAMAHA